MGPALWISGYRPVFAPHNWSTKFKFIRSKLKFHSKFKFIFLLLFPPKRSHSPAPLPKFQSWSWCKFFFLFVVFFLLFSVEEFRIRVYHHGLRTMDIMLQYRPVSPRTLDRSSRSLFVPSWIFFEVQVYTFQTGFFFWLSWLYLYVSPLGYVLCVFGFLCFLIYMLAP